MPAEPCESQRPPAHEPVLGPGYRLVSAKLALAVSRGKANVSTVVVTVVASLIVAGLLGAFAFIRRRMSRGLRLRQPVDISVQPVVGESWSVAFPGELPGKAREIEGGTHSGREVYDWLRTCGAVDVGETRLRLTVRGLSEETVVVRAIRTQTERGAPRAGTLVHCPTAGANRATLLVFDLDDEVPKAWQFREDGGRERVGSAPFFDSHNVTLAQGEVHDFLIVGHTKRYLVRWRLVLDLEIAGHRKAVTAGDSQAAYATSGVPASDFSTSLEWAWYGDYRFLPPPAHE